MGADDNDIPVEGRISDKRATLDPGFPMGESDGEKKRGGERM